MIGLFRRSTRTFSTIFDKILDKSIPSEAVFEDQHIYAFKDISPQAPVHVLIIPKQINGLSGISQAQEKNKQVLGHMLVQVPVIAQKLGLTNGKEGCQQVMHLHIHLLGGRQMHWPPG